MGSQSEVRRPSTRTSPAVGSSNRLISLSVVVLPEPLRPSKTNVSPRSTCRFTSESSARPCELPSCPPPSRRYHTPRHSMTLPAFAAGSTTPSIRSSVVARALHGFRSKRLTFWPAPVRQESSLSPLSAQERIPVVRFASNLKENRPMGAIATTVRTSQTLMARLADARARTDELFDIVRPEAIYDRPIAERHRIIFYLGHLEAFDWNLFGRALGGLKSFAPNWDKLFSFGIDPVNGDLPDDQPADWPERKEVLRYIQGLRSAIGEQLPAALEGSDDHQRTLSQFLHVAIEHRLMHVETLAYMLHRLPVNLKWVRQGPAVPRAPQVRPKMTEIPAGIATLGLRRDAGLFGWDNEFEEHSVFVPEFRIDTSKVTNLQYL